MMMVLEVPQSRGSGRSQMEGVGLLAVEGESTVVGRLDQHLVLGRGNPYGPKKWDEMTATSW